MKCVRVVFIVCLFSVMCILSTPLFSKASEDSECFKCHTSAKKLIEITREIAKTRPAAKAAESEGEG